MRSDRYKHEAAETVKRKRGPLKALLIIILLLAAAVAAAGAWSYKTTMDSITLSFTEESPELEFGEQYASMDFVTGSGGEAVPAEEFLDTTAIGEGTMTYTVSKPFLGGLFSPSKEFTLSYTVIDSTPPLPIWSGDGTVLLQGSDFNINDIIAYGDNADPEPSVDVKGKVDTATPGDYPLHVTVSDASGNSTEWDLTVTVAEEIPAYTDDSERTPFKDFMSAYKGDGRAIGIDVSAWQDDIDFQAVKNAGCEFVIMRIGYTHDGEMTIDKRFHEYYEGAKEAGLRIGIYLYSTDTTEQRVRASAQHIIELLDGDVPDLPVAFDWEDFGVFQTYGISFADLNKLYDAFADELEKAGYDCMLYSSKNYLENVWQQTDTRQVWLAHYTQKTDYEGPFMLWQASCTGRIDGIGTDVDMDILYQNE